jgi:hypothetical protein
VRTDEFCGEEKGVRFPRRKQHIKPTQKGELNMKKVIALTADLPSVDELLQPDFDNSVLRQNGMIFDDGTFVSFADMNYEQVQALYDAQVEEANAAMARLAKTWEEMKRNFDDNKND